MADEVEVLAPSAGVEVQPIAPPTITEVDDQPGEVLPEGEALSTEVEAEPEEVNLEETPEASGDFDKFKPLYKDNPDLRQIVGREQFISGIAPNGSLRELKEIVERVPTLEDAETLANDSANHRALGEAFRRDPVAFTESLRENDPLAFQQFAQKLPEILADADPNLYSEQARFYSNAVLDNLFAAAQRTGNEQALLSLQNVAAMLGVQLGSPRLQPGAQDNSEVAKLRRELAERNQNDATERASSFWEGTVQDHRDNSMTEIESLIKKSIPTVSDGQLRRMASEVWEGTNARLSQQPQTMAQINQFKAAVAKGKMSVADHKAIVDFVMKRTRQIVPLVWKDVSGEWSKQVLALNKEQIEKKKGVTPTAAPVASAPAVRSGASPVRNSGTPKKTLGSIFDQLKQGIYQKPAARA